MERESNKRPRRTPLTSEEVAGFIAFRKKRELVALHKFKKTKTFKLLNVFNVCCIFIYFELVFCYFGPCHYQKHFSQNCIAHYGNTFQINGNPIITDIDIYSVNGDLYKFVIDNFMNIPPKHTSFLVGKDYIVQKDLKGILADSNVSYRLFSASPVLFLCIFFTVISFFVYFFNLNENSHSLYGIAVLNGLNLFFITMM